MTRESRPKRKSKDKIVPRNLPAAGADKPAGKGRGKGKPGRDGRSFDDRRRRSAQAARKAAPSGGSLVEGRNAVAEALDAHIPILRAYVSSSASHHDARLDALVGRIEGLGISCEEVSRDRLDALSARGAHQGIIVETRPFSYANLADIVKRAGTGPALVIVCDHITDEGNLGAIVRSAEVVGAAGVVIAKARAARIGIGAFKTSAGAVAHVPIAQVSNLASALEELKEAGFWVGGATEHAEQLAWDAPLSGRLALVMGSEDEGISRLLRDTCDFEFKLPQRGVVESLNVAQAATVCAYEWLRRTSAGE